MKRPSLKNPATRLSGVQSVVHGCPPMLIAVCFAHTEECRAKDLHAWAGMPSAKRQLGATLHSFEELFLCRLSYWVRSAWFYYIFGASHGLQSTAS